MSKLESLDDQFYEEVKFVNNSQVERRDCDVVIIGGGGSGTVAAVRAVERGAKKVIVLEKSGRAGGNAWMAVGMFATNAAMQRNAGLKDRSDEVFKMAMDHMEWAAEPKIVRKYIKNSGTFVDWLVNKGMVFKMDNTHPTPMMLMPQRQSPHNGKDPSHGPGFVGSSVVETMVKEFDKLGIELLVKTKATKLLTDKSGNVSGVVAAGQEREIHINAKAVVIASGGFGANKEMLKEFFPEFFNIDGDMARLCLGHSTGDGITMARAIGAQTGDYNGIQLGGPCHHPWSFSVHNSLIRPESIWINKKGERFVDETVSFRGFHAMGKQPGAITYGIYDAATRDYVIEKFKEDPRSQHEIEYMLSLKEDLEKENDGRRVFIADSLEQLAVALGVEGEALKKTVERYNSFCETGYDADFLKNKEFLRPIVRAPFYAILGHRFYDTTHGGLKINENFEVISTKGNAIPGLYAVGDIASGWITQNYAPGAASLSWCFNSGYMVGEEAARYALLRPKG
ncbi:MAG: flavoprotein subunit of a reductase [Firmicutes bacterium]|nr:flavoprotein subunit of a reductase [Bacillota bacterium]